MHNDPHIARAFDRDLETIQALTMKMGGLVEVATLDAARALETRDVELAARVRDNDKAIDALEAQVNEEAARLIALRSLLVAEVKREQAAEAMRNGESRNRLQVRFS